MSTSTAIVDVPSEHAPLLSVCMVLYGGGRLALDAIAAVVAHTTIPYEVIIVDNCSPDGSGALVRAGARGIRFIGNPTNLGFGVAMNQAAEAARGPLLCLLNPDAVVTVGWAEPLVTRVRQPGAGAVAPLLLESDGHTVQEAGSFVDRTGYTFPIGTAPSGPLGPDALFARVTDYASAACLVVDRTAFERVGGFDRRFHPAYFEDTDLAFSLAACGWRTWFEPASRVRHIRGGTDVNGRALALVAGNHPKFVEKWADELARRPELDAAIGTDVTLRDWRAALRILVIDPTDGPAAAAARPPDPSSSLRDDWLAARPDALVTVVARQRRPGTLLDCEWLVGSGDGDLAALAAQRPHHYDVVLPLRPVNDDSSASLNALAASGRMSRSLIEAADAVERSGRGVSHDRHHWIS